MMRNSGAAAVAGHGLTGGRSHSVSVEMKAVADHAVDSAQEQEREFERAKRGLTLVELIVTVAILAILASAAVPLAGSR